MNKHSKQDGTYMRGMYARSFFYAQTQVLGFFLLQFGTRWGNIIIQVEESGGEWYKVVDKFITLWKTTEGRCLCYVHGRIQSHSGPKGQTDRSILIQRAVRQ